MYKATYSTGVHITVNSYRLDAQFLTSLDHLIEREMAKQCWFTFWSMWSIQYSEFSQILVVVMSLSVASLGFHPQHISECQPYLPCKQSPLCWQWGSYQRSVEGTAHTPELFIINTTSAFFTVFHLVTTVAQTPEPGIKTCFINHIGSSHLDFTFSLGLWAVEYWALQCAQQHLDWKGAYCEIYKNILDVACLRFLEGLEVITNRGHDHSIWTYINETCGN